MTARFRVLLLFCAVACTPSDRPPDAAPASRQSQAAGDSAGASANDGAVIRPNVTGATGPCSPFAEALAVVPHVVLSAHDGEFVSLWDGVRHRGCEIQFQTTDSIRGSVPVPDFDVVEDSELYRAGWRQTVAVRADGPGSGTFGLERTGVACVVRWEQPSYIDDNGQIIQSDTLSMRIQCRNP